MKIKISNREKKAMVRFKHPVEIEWFKRTMAEYRDKKTVPITLKDENGNIPQYKQEVPKAEVIKNVGDDRK